jgi:hypothetical protein
MKIRLLLSLTLLPLALLAQPAPAQFLYKSTMPDGKVIYADKPAPGAVKVEKSKPDTSKKGIATATGADAAALKKMEADRAAGNVMYDRTRSLEASLRKLEEMRDASKEPLPGERIGTAGGASRLTDEYWERQKKLDAAVERAKQELDKARAGK